MWGPGILKVTWQSLWDWKYITDVCGPVSLVFEIAVVIALSVPLIQQTLDICNGSPHSFDGACNLAGSALLQLVVCRHLKKQKWIDFGSVVTSTKGKCPLLAEMEDPINSSPSSSFPSLLWVGQQHSCQHKFVLNMMSFHLRILTQVNRAASWEPCR